MFEITCGYKVTPPSLRMNYEKKKTRVVCIWLNTVSSHMNFIWKEVVFMDDE